jgi:hypothetical protein
VPSSSQIPNFNPPTNDDISLSFTKKYPASIKSRNAASAGAAAAAVDTTGYTNKITEYNGANGGTRDNTKDDVVSNTGTVDDFGVSINAATIKLYGYKAVEYPHIGTPADADESRAQVEAIKVVSVANATGGGSTDYSVKSRYTMQFTSEQPVIKVAVPHAAPAEAALRDLIDAGYFLVKDSEISSLVGGLKLGIWDEDGTDTLASTGKFHDITTSAGTNGDMKASATAGEVNLRGESMKSLIGHFLHSFPQMS